VSDEGDVGRAGCRSCRHASASAVNAAFGRNRAAGVRDPDLVRLDVDAEPAALALEVGERLPADREGAVGRA
jgi:hypothetical protein